MTPDDSHCLDLVRRFDRERFLSTLLAPADRRTDLLALYAFNLEVALTRERVREPTIGLMRLQWWRDTLEGIGEGRIREHPVARALAATLARRALTRAHFDTLLSAREADLDDAPPATIAVLERYAADTGGSLTILAIEVLGAPGDASKAAAQAVGTAWALAGLMRAVPYHAQGRRFHLPADRLAAHRVAADDLAEGRPGPGLTAVVQEVADRAAQLLAQARSLADQIDRRALPVLSQARLAGAHLRRLKRAGYDPFAPAMHRPEPLTVPRLALAKWTGRY